MVKQSHSAGFTLIELLVVISIIGLLSSVMLAALNGARVKGKESVILGDLQQFRNLYESSNTTGNYSALQPQTLPGAACSYYSVSPNNGYICTATSLGTCSNLFGASGDINNPSALTLCNQIVGMTGNFAIGLANTSNQQFSIWAWLPSQQAYRCYGSGKTTSATTSSPASAPGNLSPGCPANP